MKNCCQINIEQLLSLPGESQRLRRPELKLHIILIYYYDLFADGQTQGFTCAKQRATPAALPLTF